MGETSDVRQRPPSVAIVGCGYAGNFHLSELVDAADDVELRAVCDVDPDAREEFRDVAADADLLAPSFEQVTTVSDLPFSDLNGVYVATPPKYHAEQVVAALDQNVHVLVEKPMAITREGAAAIRDAYASSDAELWVNYQRRYKPRYRTAKRLIQHGEIGAVESISATRVKHSPGVHRGGWRADSDLAGGGQLFDLGNHVLDVMFWLAGSYPEAHEAILSNRTDTDVEVYANVIGELDGGAPFDFSLHAYGRPSVETVHVTGSDASLRITKDGLSVYGDDLEREVDLGDDEFVKRPRELLFEMIRGTDTVEPDVRGWARLVEFTCDVYDGAN